MTTWIVGAIVAGILALAVFKLIRDRKRGKPCAGCSSCNGCDGCDGNEKRAD